MPTPEEFNSEYYRIYWPAILVVFALQMAAVIALSVAVVNHSSPTTASSQELKAAVRAERNPAGSGTPPKDRGVSFTTSN